MALPKERRQVLRTTLPSDDSEVKFSPMTGRDEKLLLIAKESKDKDEILSTVTQVIRNCLVSELDVESLPLFDIEWLFIQIRIASISDTVDVAYIDDSDGKRYEFTVDLRKVEVVKPESQKRIQVNDEMAIDLEWPAARSYVDPMVTQAESDGEMAHALAVACVVRVYDGDESYSANDHSMEELSEFVESLNVDAYKKLIEFLGSVPKLRYSIKYFNSHGQEREVVLSTLTDFFRFR